MIETDKLNLFLEEANSVIKSNIGNRQRLKPLCTYTVSDGDKSLEFGIELRGYVKDDEVFFLVVKVGDDKFFSRGYFTTHGGHYTSFAVSHDEPRGVNIQQGVLIEMKNLVERMMEANPSDFLNDLLNQLNGFKIKVQVVKSESTEIADDGNSIAKLEIKGEKKTDEEERVEERVKEIVGEENPKVPEDIVGEEFAKAVGDKEEKPDEGNPLDKALESTQVYEIKKESFWQKVVKFIRELFGLDKEKEELDTICSEMFDKKEDK